jgi:hypothetical protein
MCARTRPRWTSNTGYNHDAKDKYCDQARGDGGDPTSAFIPQDSAKRPATSSGCGGRPAESGVDLTTNIRSPHVEWSPGRDLIGVPQPSLTIRRFLTVRDRAGPLAARWLQENLTGRPRR